MKTYVDNPFESPAVISFCPGILGLERGLARTGVNCRVVAYVEIEAFIIANLVAGMESGLVDPAPIWTDAKTFDARPFRGRVHGIIGGYPCPGESLAGLREGHLYKGFLWPAIRKAIAAARPFWCFFENVDDHLTGTYPIVRRSLQHLGYAVEEGIFSAREVGSTQERKRLFILAVADSYRYEFRRRYGKIHSEAEANEVKAWFKNWQRLRNEPGHSSQTQRLADTCCEGLEGLQPGSLRGKRSGSTGPVTECGAEGFPLGQGFEQWEWEQPREIKPGMGSAINGYNFDGDLLRALGNSVVEQTAELAFITLLEKHLK